MKKFVKLLSILLVFVLMVSALPAPAHAAPKLKITTNNLGDHQIGQFISVQLEAQNGTAPITWSVTEGTLPPGMTLTSEGLYSGTPTNSGKSTFTVTATDNNNATATKKFSVNINSNPHTEYTITVATAPDGGGTATVKTETGEPGATANGVTGTVLSLKASPAAGFVFSNWELNTEATGTVASATSEETTFTVGTSNDTITAIFAHPPITQAAVTGYVDPVVGQTGVGPTDLSVPEGANYSVTSVLWKKSGEDLSGEWTFEAGQSYSCDIELTAAEGYVYASAESVAVHTINGDTVPFDRESDTTLLLKISPRTPTVPTYGITVNLSPRGGGTAVAKVGETEVTEAAQGDTVILTATPAEGFLFSNWSLSGATFEGGASTSSDANVSFSMGGAEVTATANFENIPVPSASPCPIILTADPEAGGSPKAAMDGSEVNEAMPEDQITLTANPAGGYLFKKWEVSSGGVTLDDPNSASTFFSMGSQTVEIIASYEPEPVKYNISVVTEGPEGAGSVAHEAGPFEAETEVQLIVNITEGYTVSLTAEDANGDPVSISSDYKMIMPASDVTVRAVFEAEPEPEAEKLTVSFEANGHGTAPAAQEIEKGGKASKPADPTAEGWTFGGWFREAACETAFDFDAAVEADVTVYAKWTELTPEPEPEPEEYTVKLDTDGGTEIKDQLVVEGGKLVKPADPTKPGYEFMGWFADKEGKTPFDFDKPVTADTTIYAKWQKIVYTVTKGADSTLTEGNAKELTVTVEREPNNAACFGHFESLTVGETTLKLDTDYSVKSGSTIITIKADALNKLKVGEHKIVVKFDDGEVSTKLTVNAAKTVAKDYSPKTGEERTMPLWVSLMLLSGLGLGVMFVRDGKRRTVRKH